ncbi:MAG TPA: hypothetical protein VGM37_20530 [Armatimonadota bacterium]|jgi:hypothetical protein
MELGAVLITTLVFVFVLRVITCAGGWYKSGIFQSMAPLRGRRKADIIKAAGLPNAINRTPEGHTLLQWIQPGYHIALLFDEKDICIRVTHEQKS